MATVTVELTTRLELLHSVVGPRICFPMKINYHPGTIGYKFVPCAGANARLVVRVVAQHGVTAGVSWSSWYYTAADQN